MSNKQLRQSVRWFHIVSGVLIATFVYSSSLRENETFLLLMQVVVIPSLIASGVIMWQQPKIVRLFKRRG